MSSAVITKGSHLRQSCVTKGTIQQKPEPATFAESGFGTIFGVAIGTTLNSHAVTDYYIRFSNLAARKYKIAY
jgi:hypothetical protein